MDRICRLNIDKLAMATAKDFLDTKDLISLMSEIGKLEEIKARFNSEKHNCETFVQKYNELMGNVSAELLVDERAMKYTIVYYDYDINLFDDIYNLEDMYIADKSEIIEISYKCYIF